jgi:hypothetical protein
MFAIAAFRSDSAISLLGLLRTLALVVRRSLLSGLALRSQ